jgi:hypothetical protein
MNCHNILSIHRRIRIARESALAGQCTVARRLMTTAGRDLARVRDAGPTANPCARALMKGTSEFLAEGRSQLRARCAFGEGGR